MVLVEAGSRRISSSESLVRDIVTLAEARCMCNLPNQDIQVSALNCPDWTTD